MIPLLLPVRCVCIKNNMGSKTRQLRILPRLFYIPDSIQASAIANHSHETLPMKGASLKNRM